MSCHYHFQFPYEWVHYANMSWGICEFRVFGPLFILWLIKSKLMILGACSGTSLTQENLNTACSNPDQHR